VSPFESGLCVSFLYIYVVMCMCVIIITVFFFLYEYVCVCMYKPWSAPSMKALSVDAMWFGSGLWGRLYVPSSKAKAWGRR